jgi:hypothetical protein
MQASDTKIKTDWEKLEDVKIKEPTLIQNKLSTKTHLDKGTTSKTKKTEKETPFVSNTLAQFQKQKIVGLETFLVTSFEWQKQLFDNLGIDQNVISEFGKLYHTVMRETGVTLDAYVKFSQIQSDTLADIMKMYNNFLNQGLDWYSKIMSNFITKK